MRLLSQAVEYALSEADVIAYLSTWSLELLTRRVESGKLWWG